MNTLLLMNMSCNWCRSLYMWRHCCPSNNLISMIIKSRLYMFLFQLKDIFDIFVDSRCSNSICKTGILLTCIFYNLSDMIGINFNLIHIHQNSLYILNLNCISYTLLDMDDIHNLQLRSSDCSTTMMHLQFGLRLIANMDRMGLNLCRYTVSMDKDSHYERSMWLVLNIRWSIMMFDLIQF